MAIAVVAAAPAAAQDPILINFQPAGAPVPTGYLADTGAPYGAQPDGATYGWLATADDQPIDASVATRDRGYFDDQRIDTFNHMQRADCCTTGFLDEIYWQYALPNGTYEVTLAFGDQPSQTDGYDSQHQVSVEGTLLPSTPFQPTAQEEFLEVTATVEVTDGVLTIRPTANGVNTKLNYADVVPASGGANQPPVLGAIGAQSVEDGQTLVVDVAATDADDDPISLSASGLPGFASFVDNGDGMGTLTASPQGTTGAFDLTVTADDGQGGVDSETFTLTVTAPATACGNLSPLGCISLPVALPFALDWSGDEGGLADGGGTGTGFTMVDPPSNGDGYLPALLAVDAPASALSVTTTNGIQFGPTSTNPNSLDNGLGVAFDADAGTHRLDLVLNDLPAAPGGFAQAGAWIFLDESHYVKLVAIAPSTGGYDVQLQYEQGNATVEQIDATGVLAGGDDVTLSLVLDPAAGTVEGAYAINGGAEQSAGTIAVDPSLVAGAALPSGDAGAVTFAGLFATHRNASQQVFTFDAFSLAEEGGASNAAPVLDPIASQTVEEGQSLTVPVAAADADDDPITLSASGLPAFVGFSDAGDGTGTLTATPPSGTAGSYAIEVAAADGQGGADSQTFALEVTAAPTAGAELYRLNVAGSAFTDASGTAWDADDPSLVSGTTSTSSTNFGSATDPIAGTTDDNLYLTRRFGADFTYDLPVPSGTYDVELHFAEIYQGLSANGDCPVGGDCTGARLFDVEAEGQLVLDNLDLYVEAGTATAHVETLSGVGVADGTLSLRFFLDANGADNAIVQGIVVREADGDAPAQPQITSTIPADGATGVDVATQVTAYVSLPTAGQGVDASTVNASTVKLYPTGSPTAEVPANYNTTGGADAFTLQPTAPLDAFTSYTYVVDGVKDEAGAAFPTYAMTFTTGAATTPGDGTVAFTKSQVASGAQYTSVVVGPDGKLYGLVNDGEIHRWTIEADGTLSGKETITALQDAEGGQRLAIGLAFDPDATAGALVAWVSHTTYGFGGMADWGGKISRLSGAALGTVEDYVVNLPRSAKDHVTNGIDFGPDGALYVNQGSNSAMGAPDGAWSNRPERKLTAAVLRVDVDALEAGGALPVDVQTTDGGSYDPYDASAPVKLFATGIRNMYDLVWHSNGNLYVPTNGSASGGNAPASVSGTVRPDGAPYAGQAVPALNNISTQPDLLFRIPAPTPGTGGDIASADGQWSWGYQYHGHPNPTRGEYVLNGGNPTGGADPLEVDEYPVGIDTDPDYAGIAYNFDFSKSPNGVIEYRSTAFGGALQGKILVVRYSGGDDIIVLSPGGTSGDISSAETGLDGLTGFNNPLDLTENVATGDLYVSEYGSGTITLVRPADPPADAPVIAAAPEEVVVSGFTASTKPDYTVDVVVSNEGAAPLNVSGATVSGPDAGAFAVDPASFSLAAGESTTLTVAFAPSSTGPLEAALALASNDPATPTLTVPLYGLASSDFEGSDEPPLAQIVETLGYAIDVGFTSLASDGNSFPIGDEVLVDAFEKAGSGPVEIVPVARYAPAFPVPFGWYVAGGGSSPALNVVGTLSGDGSGTNPHHQMLFPPLEGGGTTFDAAEVSFDPGAGAFGLFAQSPDQVGYTEDAINAPTNAGSLHRTRIYPLKDRTGTAIPNTYLVGFEEAHNHDHNDYVFVVSNVTPAAGTDGVLVASSSAVDFGTVQTGNAATAVVTLSNAGSSDISLTGASVTGDASFELVTAPLPSLVPAGGAVDLDLSFAPQGGGASTATLTVAHDGVDAPLTVALSGSGIEIGTEAVVRLNAGEGGAYTDSDGQTWAADQYVTGASTPGTKAFDVAGTDDDGLYLYYRFADGTTDVGDPFGYAIPVADGAYVVNLHFAEIYHGVQTNDGLGARVFDVAIEGTEVLTDYDIVADVGPGTAVVKTVETTVSDGTLNVDFTSDVNNAIIAAIEVLPADTGTPTPVLAELVVSEGDASQALAFGTAAGATGGYDAGLDGALLPPIPPSPPARFAARFVCGPATNPDCSSDFAVHTDVRAPLGSGGTAGAEGVRVWTVQTSRASGGALTLDWSGASLAEALPAGQLVLRDAASGGQAAFADMLAQTSLTVDNPNVETFEIVYAPQATRPVAAAAGWNLLGLPLEPAGGTAAAVFGADAPATDLFVFDGGTYQPAGTESVPLVTGAGFWAFYDAAPTLTVEGAPVSAVTWTLAPGWNLVSGPSCAVALSAASGDVGVMVPGTFYAYAVGSSYTEADAANPGVGYWVNATEAGTVTLSCESAGEPVLATTSASGASASGASASGGASGAALTRALARVRSAAARSDALVISDAAGRSQRLLLDGASGADRAGVPAAAFALPPLPPRGAFDARFEGGSGATSAEAGAGSRRMTGPEGRLVVRGAVGDRVRLRLDSSRPQARYQVETVDARGRAIESIWVEAGRAANASPVELSLAGAEALRVRSEGAVPSGFAVQGTSPNPTRAADATLRIDAPAGGEVSVSVYDVLGREVLKAGRVVAAGPARALRLPTGELAAGLYLYRVELRTADGQAFRGTGRLTVVR